MKLGCSFMREGQSKQVLGTSKFGENLAVHYMEGFRVLRVSGIDFLSQNLQLYGLPVGSQRSLKCPVYTHFHVCHGVLP